MPSRFTISGSRWSKKLLCLQSRLARASISSAASPKSKLWKFSVILDLCIDLGMTATPRWMCQTAKMMGWFLKFPGSNLLCFTSLFGYDFLEIAGRPGNHLLCLEMDARGISIMISELGNWLKQSTGIFWTSQKVGGLFECFIVIKRHRYDGSGCFSGDNDRGVIIKNFIHCLCELTSIRGVCYSIHGIFPVGYVRLSVQ